MSDTKPKPSAISLLFGVPEVATSSPSGTGLNAVAKARAKARQSRAEGMQPPKPRTCAAEGCGNPLVKRARETWPTFAGRLYCSHACRSATVAKRMSQRCAMESAARPKVCVECGRPFTKRVKESWFWFSQRRRCRPECDGTAAPADMADGE